MYGPSRNGAAGANRGAGDHDAADGGGVAVSGVPTAPSWYVIATSIAAATGILAARERARTALA